jgi:hypothetical protein
MIGYQEHDLDTLKLTTYHKVFPVFGNRLIARSYDQDGNYEGYQYGMYSEVSKNNNPYEGWEPELITYLLERRKKIQLLHVAFDVEHNLVKKDIRVSFKDLPKLSNYYADLEKIDDVDFLVRMGMSSVVNVQFYVNKNMSIEFMALDTALKRNMLLEHCVTSELLTTKQKHYVKEVASEYYCSVKFGWKNGKLTKKCYVRDINNWEGG